LAAKAAFVTELECWDWDKASEAIAADIAALAAREA